MCPACDCPDAKYLGTLGHRDHFRCNDCGLDFSHEIDDVDDSEDDEEENEREDHFRDDVEADADALASAGFGTDEDYGCYGGEDC